MSIERSNQQISQPLFEQKGIWNLMSLTNNLTQKLRIGSTVRLRFIKSTSGYHFQTIGKLDSNDFNYHTTEVFNSIYWYNHTKKCIFSSYKKFSIGCGSFWLLSSWPFWPVFDSIFCLFFQIFSQFLRSYAEIRT